MDRDSDRETAGVRALLAVAAGDGPPATDLLAGVRRRMRRQRIRRRVLLPSLATLATASVLAVAVLAASVLTGAPSAQARVVAAAGRTANEGYRVRIVSTKSIGSGGPTGTEISEGVFDPARRTGRLLVGNPPVELRFLGDMVYFELPERSGARRWVAERRAFDAGADMPLFVQLTKLTWQNPQQALVRLRSAAAVRDQGHAAGDGWSGRRYAFELTGDQGAKAAATVTGSVEVDQAGRVRRLEVAERLTAGPGGTVLGTVRTVMEFRDYGARETVSAPPASAIDHDPPSKLPSKARSEKATQKAAHP
jgi:hypothetical protein